MQIAAKLATNCERQADTRQWLRDLPETIRQIRDRCALTLGRPFEGDDVSCAWVVPAEREDGTRAILKLAMPHMEGAHEIEGLRFWAGDPTVKLLEADDRLGAMLLERCEPGTSLRRLPEHEQDVVISKLLRRLWRLPNEGHPFRPLIAMTAYWAEEAVARRELWRDAG